MLIDHLKRTPRSKLTWTRTGCAEGGADDQRRRTISTTSIGTSLIPRDASSSRREKRAGAKRRASNSSECVGMLLCATITSNLVAHKCAAEPEAGNSRLASRRSSGGSERPRRWMLAVGGVEREVVDCAGSATAIANIRIVAAWMRMFNKYTWKNLSAECDNKERDANTDYIRIVYLLQDEYQIRV